MFRPRLQRMLWKEGFLPKHILLRPSALGVSLSCGLRPATTEPPSSTDAKEPAVIELGVVTVTGVAAQVLHRSFRREGRSLDGLLAEHSDLSEGVFGERGGAASYSVFERRLCRGRSFPCTGLRGEVATGSEASCWGA